MGELTQPISTKLANMLSGGMHSAPPIDNSHRARQLIEYICGALSSSGFLTDMAKHNCAHAITVALDAAEKRGEARGEQRGREKATFEFMVFLRGKGEKK